MIFKLFFMLLFFFSSSALFGQSASELFKMAEESEKAGKLDEAERFYLDAAEKAPQSGFYQARAGQFFLKKRKNALQALKAYQKAWEKGFDAAWMVVQAYGAAKDSGDAQGAEEWLLRAASRCREKLSKGGLGEEDSLRIRDELIRYQGLLCGMSLDEDKITEACERGRAGYEIDAATKVYDLVYHYSRALFWDSATHFSSGEWELAAQGMALALELVRRQEGTRKKWESYYEQLALLYRNRAELGDKKPEYVHKILVLILSETDAPAPEGGEGRIGARVDQEAREALESSLGYFQSMISACSDGNLAVECHVDDPAMKLGKLLMDAERDRPDTRYRAPDLTWLCAEYEDFFAERLHAYDTVILIWMAGEYNMSNAGSKSFVLPKRGESVVRGYIQIPAERLKTEGYFLLTHEFFHVVENMVGITVRHGFQDDQRSNFPAWKGKTELDYYRWQYTENIPALLGKRGVDSLSALNFMMSYPFKGE